MRARALLILMLVMALTRGALAQNLTLRAGTPVGLAPQLDVTTHLARGGETAVFVVTEPVQVDGVTVISEGAVARGAVVFSQGAGVGHGARLIVSVDSVQAVDGTWIPLRGVAADGGGDEIVPSSALKRGKAHFPNGRDVVLAAGTRFTAFVDDTRAFRGSGDRVVAVNPVADAPQGQVVMRVPEGTPITLHAIEDLNSNRLKPGQRVLFVVSAPLRVNGRTVVKAGAPAEGTVVFSRRSGWFNRRGKLALVVERVQAADGSWLDVTATRDRIGDNQSFFTPPGVPGYVGGLTFVLPGRAANLTRTRTFNVYASHDQYFTLDRSAAGTERVIALPPDEP